MSNLDRKQKDLDGLAHLKKSSSIFDFVLPNETDAESLMEFVLIFHGKGVRFDDGELSDSKSELVNTNISENHRVSIAFPEDYPVSAPQVRFLTTLVHPNIPFSGIVDLEDIGLQWQEKMSLEVLCDRLWNVTRLGYTNLNRVCNNVARKWLEEECTLTLPVDRRTLRNRSAAAPRNIVSYKPRDTGNKKNRKKKSSTYSVRTESAVSISNDDAVLYIDEDSAPKIPDIAPSQAPSVYHIRDDREVELALRLQKKEPSQQTTSPKDAVKDAIPVMEIRDEEVVRPPTRPPVPKESVSVESLVKLSPAVDPVTKIDLAKDAAKGPGAPTVDSLIGKLNQSKTETHPQIDRGKDETPVEKIASEVSKIDEPIPPPKRVESSDLNTIEMHNEVGFDEDDGIQFIG